MRSYKFNPVQHLIRMGGYTGAVKSVLEEFFTLDADGWMLPDLAGQLGGQNEEINLCL